MTSPFYVRPVLVVLALTSCSSEGPAKGTGTATEGDTGSGEQSDTNAAESDTAPDDGETAAGEGAGSEETGPLEPPCMQAASWAPQRDDAGIITNFHCIPERTWTEIPDSSLVETIQPVLDASGYTLYSWGTDKLAAVMTNYNGMAWDMPRGTGYAHGGGHEGGSDNGVYGVDLYSMGWSVVSYPSHPSTDLTPEQARFYGEGTHASGAGGSGTAHVYPLADSSTGFAIKDWLSYSTCNWYAVTGPERDVEPADIVFPNGDPWSAAGSHPVESPFVGGGDVMFDGRPTARHTYGGMLYSPVSDEIVMVVRNYWKSKTDGSGWIKSQDGGGAPPTFTSGELIWSQIDEQTGLVWWGGCGSGCWESGYYFYGAGYIVDPTTMTDSPSPSLIPDNAYGLVDGNEVMLVNAGDMVLFSFKAGRKLGWWMRNGYGFTFDLDTQERQLLHMDGEPYSGNTDEGNSAVYLAHRDELWLFDTHDSTAPAWSMAMEPVAGGPNESLVINAKREVLDNADLLPPSPAGLVYTRMAFWPEENLLVYFPDATKNAWVARVP
ncbi:MAG: hypothetical protein IAG13_12100 [Deltaproteobacteria bacterium]|nr:hypothetical protein [Nannocystaceae bacterium]